MGNSFHSPIWEVSMDQVLELKNIHYTYHTLDGETPALTDISFSLNKGEFVAIVGPSGCGKSTLLSLIAGLIVPEKGLIKINGKYLRESTTNIGYMLQHDELFEWRTIYHNVLLGLEIQHMLSAKTKARAHELLDIYGLKNFENSHPSELSGGMRQRAALIRTLVLEPDILLLDEPFSALDMLTKSAIHDWYLQVMEQIQLSTLFVTHDIDEAILLSDRVCLLTGKPGHITREIRIEEPRPRGKDFPLSRRFLEYKQQILSHLESQCSETISVS